ncbi:hypothetical protein [Methylomonas albis]|uniref:Uncharacterized protein n=1 Tax=Methylomonas albis TaxID=1854563 RepID=A0ABR9D258_9GAMM|nr:hypothetical protein [Methylomonas albis]MBD9357198.1 hypothetical protein [Methylomonas albis]
MRNKEKFRKIICTATLLSCQAASAAIIPGIQGNSTTYQIVNVASDDTVQGDISFHNGVINNKGLIKTTNHTSTLQGGSSRTVTLNNDGNILFEGGITAGTLSIFNNPDGYMVFTNYIDGYQTTAIENAGTIAVANGVGDGIGAPAGSWVPFTYMFQGLIHNTGKFLIQRKNTPDGYDGGNVCLQWGRILTVNNEGYFEVGSGSKCDFGSDTASQYNKATYIQNSGETRINGTFGAHVLDFKGGTLSGAGKVLRFPEQLISARFTISPGGNANAPFSELTLVPEIGYSVLEHGALDFAIGGVNNNSKLHVDGDVYIVGNAKINVILKIGFVPSAGNSFTLLTANYVGTDDFNQDNLNLPKLPAGLQWHFENDGTSLKLSVI